MPRSSSHKSHRSHKHSSKDGDSEDDRSYRERKPRAEGPAAGSGPRVSRDAEPEKRKSSSSSLPAQEKELKSTGNGDSSGENRKKRKDRVEDSAVGDRWSGSGKDDLVDKKAKREGLEPADLDKNAKSKLSDKDPKGRSGRRREASTERNEESGSRVESAKQLSEKDSSRKESSIPYKEAKDRDRDFRKDSRERDRDDSKDSREKDLEYSKDSRERNRDYSKDSRERDRDYSKDARDRDRDYSKDARERDRDYCRDSREKERDYCKDARERDRDYYKDSREKERDYYYKDANERDRKDAMETDRHRGSERDKKVPDAKQKRSDDVVSRKQVSKICISKEEGVVKMDIEIADRQMQTDLCNPELEKDLDKHVRRDRSGEKDKCPIDDTESDDKLLSSRDDYTKNCSYKDESHKEGRNRDKYRGDFDRDQRHRDDRVQDERPSRDHNSNMSDSKYVRDDSKAESRYMTSKLQGGDHDSSLHVDDHGTKPNDNRGRKRYYDEYDNHVDLKHRSTKEPHEDVGKNSPYSHKFDSHSDRARLDHLHLDKGDSSLGSKQRKSSPGSSNRAVQDQSRISSNQAGSSCKRSLSEETLRPSTALRGDHATVSGIRDKASESRSLEKTRTKDAILADELLAEVAASQHERVPKSSSHTSPNPVAEKSPSTSDRLFSDKTGVRRGPDVEGQKSSCSKDGRDYSNAKDRERALRSEKSSSGDLSRAELLNSEPVSVGPSSFSRTGHISGSSPNHRHPQLPIRHGIDSPVLGSYEDDNRVQIEDRKANIRYKRISDHGTGRGQGNTWKSDPTWPSQVANGFIPLQHGPPPPGFHPAIQQFPAPPLFGVRPSIDLNHTRVSYQLHEAADRFSGHGRPFGWPNPVDGFPHHLQVWDGSNGAFGDEPHVFGRPDWDMERHLMSGRGWEMSADVWKGRNGNVNIEPPLPQDSEYSARALPDKRWVGQAGNRSRNEWPRLERLPSDKSEIKRFNYKSPENNAVETPQKSLLDKPPEPSKAPSAPETSKTPSDDSNVRFCCKYLSKLDISLDLVHPELYKQCVDMVGSYNNSESEVPQNNKEDTRMAAKKTNRSLHPLFPPRTDAVFQRALSLYQKQSGGRKAMFRAPSPVCSEKRDPSEPSVAQLQIMEGVVCSEDKGSLKASEAQEMVGDVRSEVGDSSEASEAQEMEQDVSSEEGDSSEASEAQEMERDVSSEEGDSSEASEAQEMEGDMHSEERDSSEASGALEMEGVDNQTTSATSLAVKVEAADNQTADQTTSATSLEVKVEAAGNHSADQTTSATSLSVKVEAADNQTADQTTTATSLAVKVAAADNQTTSAISLTVKVEAADDQTAAVASPAADNQASAVASPATADLDGNMGEVGGTTNDAEGSYPGDAKEPQQSDAIRSVEGSESGEAATAECRVNLSRIHLSPGSTH